MDAIVHGRRGVVSLLRIRIRTPICLYMHLFPSLPVGLVERLMVRGVVRFLFLVELTKMVLRGRRNFM